MRFIQIIILSFLTSCGQTQTKSIPQSVQLTDTIKSVQQSKTMFDPTNLTESDKRILEDFFDRRKLFDMNIKDKGLKIFTCPGCGYPTLTKRGNYNICEVCNWEDDNQDDKETDKVWGGPNGNRSLTENRLRIGKILVQNSDSLKGKINLDPNYVLEAIEFYDKKKKSIESRMTGEETLDHPIWTEWEQVEKDLQIALCREKLE